MRRSWVTSVSDQSKTSLRYLYDRRFCNVFVSAGVWMFLQQQRREKRKRKKHPRKTLTLICQTKLFFSTNLSLFPLKLSSQVIKIVKMRSIFFFFFFLSGFSFTKIHESQDCRGRADISLTPFYHFHPLHRHLGISREIAAESSPLHIASRWTLVSLSSHW